MLKKTKQNSLKSAALVAALACAPLFAQAAGLGRITVLSALGQPLKAELEVTANRDELNSLAAKLASADSFRLAGIDYAPALSALHFSRDIKERSGKRYIEVTTDRPLNEPFVDMLVELSWASGRLVREYTFLLDPPGLPAPVPVPVAVPEVKPTPVPVAPVVDKVPEPISVPAAELAVSPKPAVSAKPVAKTPAPAVEKAAPALASGQTRLVKPGDTLGRIASETMPSGVSLDQMLVALFRSNADAFDGNMNRLRSGKILSLPDAETARSIDANDARKEIVAQSADFNAYRKKLAGIVDAGPDSAAKSGRSSSGKITPKIEDKVPAATAGKDKLEVSRTEAPAEPAAKSGGKGPAMQGRLSALEEDVVSRDRALREASGRIAQLEKNLGDLKKLAELKSEAGVVAQKQAEVVKQSSGKLADVPPIKATEAPATPKANEPTPALAAATSLSATPATDKPAAISPPTPPETKKALPPPEPEVEPDFIEENGPLVFGGAGVLALLLGYLGFSAYRRKRQSAEAAPISQSELSTNSVFGDSSSTPVTDLAPSEFSVSESMVGQDDTVGEAVDPLVEADTYLAFGRDAQAEEILLEALKNAPTRHPIHVKLLEIYAARRSSMQFNTLAQELRDQTGGVGGDWERVRILGQSLDPNNSLYSLEVHDAAETIIASAVELSQESPLDPDATMVFSAPPVMEAPPAEPAISPDEVATLDFDLDLGEPDGAEVTPEATVITTVDTSSGLDFDLDLGSPASAESAAATAPDIVLDEPATEVVAQSNDAMALDIDFDLDAPVAAEAPAVDFAGTGAIAFEPTPTPPITDADALALDIDFDTPAVSSPEPESLAVDEVNVVDFNLDMEAPPVASGQAIEIPAADLSTMVLDLPVDMPDVVATEVVSAAAPALDFDFDLGESEATTTPVPVPAVAPTALDLSSISLELDMPPDSPTATELEPVVSAGGVAESAQPDNPEAATKLELALAYEEMGDRDGARELLEEVVTEGSPSQRDLAQAKLDLLG